ncbi:ATP-dependent DNA helicase RecQ [Natronocella acetinitrilica]|uniref:ATP-dependent DNA helicase RecQ n=1 Tax=Natronocella acetinitrilica TaxID=414046 RepID=A0AAE3G4E9_9GAMM|nr:RecQ family ATP-dependent DNA helicase [Natronocella acetinitrilica]MCP1674188.1 ATP-dependent DNA helicase RecQ [Natronocella acetinitrilica]
MMAKGPRPVQVLRDVFGYQHFRGAQADVIEPVMAGRDVLALMRTGGGKSLCYQVPALALPGTAIVVSPLISLMKDQVDRLQALGVPAQALHSGLAPEEALSAIQGLQRGAFKLFYVAPERLLRADFRRLMGSLDISFVAVDEAHCVSMWGHDFRTAYTRLAEAFAEIESHRGSRLPRIALTATATPVVRADIVSELRMQDPAEITSSFARENLRLSFKAVADKDAALDELLARHAEEPTLVYASTVRAVEEIYERLSKTRDDAARYHGRLPSAIKHREQERFLLNDARLMIATTAFGMGIDKPDIRNVIHYQMPGTIESYYQEAGRAGRDDAPAVSYVLYTRRDRRLHEFFIDAAYPRAEVVESVRQTIAAITDDLPVAVTFRELADMSAEPMQPAHAESALRILADQGAVELEGYTAGQGSSVVLGERERAVSLDHLAERRRLAFDNLAAMERLATTSLCRTRNILRHFGEEPAREECGNCDRCLARDLSRNRLHGDIDTPAFLAAYRLVRDNRERLSRGRLGELLCGHRDARTRRQGLDAHPDFAALAHYSESDMRHLLNRLEREGFLSPGSSESPRLCLTDKAHAAAAAIEAAPDEPSSGRANAPARPKAPSAGRSVALRDAILELRARLARQADKPELMVLPNALVERLASAEPTEEQALLAAGLSAARIRLFGADLLRLVREHQSAKAVRVQADDGPGGLF